jgi:hypothetical protein
MKTQVLIALFLVFNLVHAQENMGPAASGGILKSNAIGVSGGFFPIYTVLNFHYERRVFNTEKGFFKTYFVRASGGNWDSMSYGGHHAGLSACGLTGLGKHHFELRIGAISILETGRYNNEKNNPNNFPDQQPVLFKNYVLFWPSGSMAYRFQKPDRPFIFRVGAGYPEAVFVGLGLAF